MLATSKTNVPFIGLHMTNGDTKSPWDWANEATDRIVNVSPTVSPDLRMQAIAFKDEVRRVIAHNIEAALREERIFLANRAEMFGVSDFASMVLARKTDGEHNFNLT